jgi:two-component system nitrogen regulation response regulator NtrX
MFICGSVDIKNMTKTVLIIDDSPDFREAVIDILIDNDFDIYEASCPKDGFEILFREKVDLILCDLNMPFSEDNDKNEFVIGNKVGILTIKELGFAFPDMPIICITAEDSFALAKAAKELGDIPLLSKPVPCKTLLMEIDKAINMPFNQSHYAELITH